jgi:glycyl-tRNA synthetase
MSQPLDFQSMILALQHFWADYGCLIWQPYNHQVGAGTMNPATFLRVLGPEPWNVAYVEPSVRPDDGRYGENPYRLQQHTQFQVILKPDPGNPQEIYLRSLQALGIDPREHDIRFVEDNWESPALGAWGLGWEVWLDGQEITQFTYFQQAGGQVLDPVSVEITYGLERIAMPLQRVSNFRDLRWNGERTYGDVLLMGEYEHSKYYFEIADVERLREMYRLYEAEVDAALAQGLVLPAHDYLLKCSHAFNVLDTRGAIGVTERQAFFARMRDSSRRISEVYVAQRQAREFPWLQEKTAAAPVGVPELPLPTAPADLVFEIGVEELPAVDLAAALAQLQERVPALLTELRLAHGEVQILGAPRRLTVVVRDLAPRQPDRTQVVKGPPADRAFDAAGQPTPAAVGFARSRGLPVEALQITELDGGRYAAATVHEAGRPAAEVLREALPGLIAGIKFDKSMRWNASGVAFSRPIRWLLALLGEQVVPFSYAGLQSDCKTRGLRFHTPEVIEVHSVADYFTALSSQGIMLDPAERRAAVADQVRRLMDAAGGDPRRLDAGLLDEVTALVEAPTALTGTFAADHLRLPPEVLISVMKKHQRYFPVLDRQGRLLPVFIAVRNGDEQGLDVVADGNEQVIRARFADADFFIRQDLQHKLPDLLPRLGTLTFQKKLGSMLDKTHRIEQVTEQLTAMLGLNAAEAEAARRAALLCKADLVSHMVIEMTSVQGVMGRYYALSAGERETVAQAIFEHYLPRYAGDTLPQGRAGLVVGLADRLDTLAGLFAAGLAPSGTKDPFAQRRAALGLVGALIGWDLDFDLRTGLEAAAAALPFPAAPESQAACLEFIQGRLQSLLLEQSNRHDIVAAVMAVQGANPAGAARAIRALAERVNRPDWNTVLPAYARCVRITRDQPRTTATLAGCVEPVERELLTALQATAAAARQPGSVADFFAGFEPLIPLINRFFDTVLVMAEDSAVRANRLGLLQQIAALADGVADFSKLEGF